MAKISLSQQTAARIEEIVARQYKPGDKVPPEMQLAEFLGVSRTTIREAVKLLCSKNILEIRRGYGTYVCENPGMPPDLLGVKEMTRERLQEDIFEMSKIFEPELVRLSAEKSSDEKIEKMYQCNDELMKKYDLYRAGAYVKPSEFRRLDVNFHKAVIEGCDNQVISRSLPMFLATCKEWYIVWNKLELEEMVESDHKYHALILEAVKNHDGEAAYQHSLEHTLDIIEHFHVRNK